MFKFAQDISSVHLGYLDQLKGALAEHQTLINEGAVTFQTNETAQEMQDVDRAIAAEGTHDTSKTDLKMFDDPENATSCSRTFPRIQRIFGFIWEQSAIKRRFLNCRATLP